MTSFDFKTLTDCLVGNVFHLLRSCLYDMLNPVRLTTLFDTNCTYITLVLVSPGGASPVPQRTESGPILSAI